jgi:hypothetical protein
MMSGFDEWWEGEGRRDSSIMDKFNCKRLWDYSEHQAIERTKAACVEAVKTIQNPYPEGVSSIANDAEYARVIKNPSVRTAVSWYLAGKSFGLYQHDTIQVINDVEVE